MSFMTTLMDLKGIMLSKISQAEEEKYIMIFLICRIKKIKKKEKNSWIQRANF